MIRFEGVCKYFLDDQRAALEDISFTVDDGEFVFVTGHSGSGKTTLLRLLLREYRPNSGRVFFDEQDLGRLSRGKVAKHRRQVGVVFQDYQLLDDLTVWENIALPLVIAQQDKKEIKSRINELLKLLDLEGYEQAFPVQLSGGEAQRIGLARALATAPKVIFADEPTGNLDNKNAFDILGLLQSVNKYGTTVIVATHNLTFLDQVPGARQVELKKGKIVKDTKEGGTAGTGGDASIASARPEEGEAAPRAVNLDAAEGLKPEENGTPEAANIKADEGLAEETGERVVKSRRQEAAAGSDEVPGAGKQEAAAPEKPAKKKGLFGWGKKKKEGK